MKYIIKNCPSCRNHNVFGLEEEGCCYNYMDYCKKHPDCLIKQIVEKCETIKAINKRNTYVGKYIGFKEINPLADEILNLLDIQEIEE